MRKQIHVHKLSDRYEVAYWEDKSKPEGIVPSCRRIITRSLGRMLKMVEDGVKNGWGVTFTGWSV